MLLTNKAKTYHFYLYFVWKSDLYKYLEVNHSCLYYLSLYRKVQNESATGSSTSHRVRTTLTVRIESVDFDTQACLLRLKGRNIEENDYVKVTYLFKK